MLKKKLHAIESAFLDSFTGFFLNLGFRAHKIHSFIRMVNGIEQSVAIFPTEQSRGGAWELTAGGLGVRLPKVEELRARDGFESASTVGTPIHLLKEDKKYESWRINHPDDIIKCAHEVQARIVSTGLPYLERFSSSEAVIAKLKSDDWQEWFVVTPDSRDSILVCAEWANNGANAGLELGKKLFEKYETRHPKYSSELSSLLKRLQAERAAN